MEFLRITRTVTSTVYVPLDDPTYAGMSRDDILEFERNAPLEDVLNDVNSDSDNLGYVTHVDVFNTGDSSDGLPKKVTVRGAEGSDAE